jgi:NADP-dependent 3-hydroxy acid dehydrogenase YdfG
MERAGRVAVSVTADVSDEGPAARAITKPRHELGPVDLLINIAGIVSPVGPAGEIEPDCGGGPWRSTSAARLLSTQLVLPEMVGRRRGRIVNLSGRARGVPVAACVSTAAWSLRAQRHGGRPTQMRRSVRSNGHRADVVLPRRSVSIVVAWSDRYE